MRPKDCRRGSRRCPEASRNSSVSLAAATRFRSKRCSAPSAMRPINRCVQLCKIQQPIVTSTKQFVWNGNSIVEERDANNNVTRRFYPQVEQISGVKYFYARDHLGSVRELVDSASVVRARYDY